MKILAFSDLHRDADAAQAVLEAASDADVVVGAGDFGTQGRGELDTLDVLSALRCPFVIVHGNHDDPTALRQFAQDRSTVYYLHGDGVEIGGRHFFGVGGEVPVLNDAEWNAGQSEDETAHLLSTCPSGAVLVTHSPPLGYCDLQRDNSHEGSAAILASAEATHPTHILCGHIHNGWGTRSAIGASKVANIGPTPVNFYA